MAPSRTAKPTLCTLPPECLLVIISHLPPSTYTPLVHTSHFFLQFFSTHASTVCNTRILTHFPRSASYLDSKYIDGWLVPSHSAIADQEKLLLCPPALHTFNEQLKGCFLLSSPGPQYLLFLTQYDLEIRTRREMVFRELATLGDKDAYADADEDRVKIVQISDTEDVDGERERKSAAFDGIEERFTYMVGAYAVRPFLRRLDDLAGDLEERRVWEARKRFHDCLERITHRPADLKIKAVVKKAGARWNGTKKKASSAWRGLGRRLKREKRELCFGEIEPEERTEKDGFGPTVRDRVIDGLLWHYGSAGVLDFRSREQKRPMTVTVNVQRPEGIMKVDKLEEPIQPRQKYVESAKICVKKALDRMGKVAACFGTKRNFESLD